MEGQEGLELESDGIPELVVISTFYEGRGFAIYSRDGGRWNEIYRGGYSGC